MIIREMLFLLLHAHMTHLLIVVTICLYIIGLFVPLNSVLLLRPIDTLSEQWWGIITANFIHNALWHITGNMLGLLVFGPPVERVFGAIRFFCFYLISGILAMLVISIRGCGAAGASGALAGVIGTLVIFSSVWRKKSDAGRGLFTLTIAGSILFLFSGTILESTFGINIADDAHITGFVFGLLVALILWRKKLIPLSPFINVH
ncbi:MAG: rhomboid family intramembrane serine protease [Planctomycetota bacterium]